MIGWSYIWSAIATAVGLAGVRSAAGRATFAATRRFMEDLARARDGEYDGWEAVMQPVAAD